MSHDHDRRRRVLAVDPTTKGFGFAVLEGADSLVDWGIRICQCDKETSCLRRVEELCDRYKPDVLVLEDYTARGFRRCRRVRALIRSIGALGLRRNVRARFIPRSRLSAAVASAKAGTKGEIARAVAQRFPELARHLPVARRPWNSEDARMAIFDAVALALSASTHAPAEHRL